MSGYSLDLRQRVLAAVARGMPRQEVVTTFAISLGTLKRWLAKQRRGLDLTPSTPPGPQPAITPAHHAALRAQLEAHPDATLAQHAAVWNAAYGTTLSQWTLGRAIRSMGWTRKKRRWVPPSATRPSGRRFARGSPPVQRRTSSSWMRRAVISISRHAMRGHRAVNVRMAASRATRHQPPHCLQP